MSRRRKPSVLLYPIKVIDKGAVRKGRAKDLGKDIPLRAVSADLGIAVKGACLGAKIKSLCNNKVATSLDFCAFFAYNEYVNRNWKDRR